jgi:hypothetical protein
MISNFVSDDRIILALMDSELKWVKGSLKEPTVIQALVFRLCFVKYHTGFSAFSIDNIAKVHLVSHVYDIKFCI